MTLLSAFCASNSCLHHFRAQLHCGGFQEGEPTLHLASIEHHQLGEQEDCEAVV